MLVTVVAVTNLRIFKIMFRFQFDFPMLYLHVDCCETFSVYQQGTADQTSPCKML